MVSYKKLGCNRWFAFVLGFFGLAVMGFSQETSQTPVKVKIQDDKVITVEPSLPVEPQIHAQVNTQNNMMINLRIDNKTMHLGFIQTVLKIDGQVIQNGNFPLRAVIQNQRLPQKPGKKSRVGFMSVYEVNKVRITQIAEVVPTKAVKGRAKRRMDSMMVQYLVENNDTRPHQVGARVWLDMFLVNNDGALFAAPTKPGQILDGMELRGKDVPDYLQVLQIPNLQNPGFVGHFTFNFGKGFEKASRVIMTNLGGAFGNGWDMQIFKAMGDSAIGFYWDPKDLPPGQKRNLAYGYGEGICPNLEGDGQFAVNLGGSFEPGKLFTIAAYVKDPAQGQTLTLELPPGMQRIEGKERQPVPIPGEDGNTMVFWKARVLRTGTFPLRIHSSSGVTHTKLITISR